MAAPVNSLLSNNLASNSLVQPSLPLADVNGKADGARIQEVAKQLEGQFAQMLIKCMRDASFGDSLFPGENQTFRDMYDQQLAKAMTQGKGLGLAPMIARQLGGTEAPAPASTPNSYGLSEYRRMLPSTETGQMLDAIAGRSGTATGASSEANGDNLPLTIKQLTIPEPDACEEVETVGKADPQKYARNTPERFVAEVWSHAEKAAKELGVDPRALVAQAALETGWGRRGIQRGDGGSANNLFGIKATGWKGDRVRTGTHEYTNGVKHSETADFRAYNSPAESFADYVRLLKNSPRYQQALAAGKDIHGFAKGLQKAGYATDPSYANKIASIANGPTLGKVLSAMRSTVDSALNTAVASSAGDALRTTLRR